MPGFLTLTSGMDKRERYTSLTDFMRSPLQLILVFTSYHSRIFETLNGDRQIMRQNAFSPPRISEAKRFDFIGEKRESSVRLVFRGVLEVFLVDRIPGDARRERWHK